MGLDAVQAGQLRWINDDASITYYKAVLGADEYINDILEDNYTIPLYSWPHQYQEPNNASAETHKTVLWDKMIEWEKAGYCERTQKKPHCCNPMTVAEKLDLSIKEIKLRLYMDFRRHVNNYIPKQPPWSLAAHSH